MLVFRFPISLLRSSCLKNECFDNIVPGIKFWPFCNSKYGKRSFPHRPYNHYFTVFSCICIRNISYKMLKYLTDGNSWILNIEDHSNKHCFASPKPIHFVSRNADESVYFVDFLQRCFNMSTKSLKNVSFEHYIISYLYVKKIYNKRHFKLYYFPIVYTNTL